MIDGMLGRVQAGDLHPVRLMGVINLSRESFYKGSVAGPEAALPQARSMREEGADLIDLGAVSTAPGSQPISEAEERERLFPALRAILENLEIDVSVDTQRASIANEALSLGATCINDVSGLVDSEMAATVAEHDASLIIMASRRRPGDLIGMTEIITLLGERVRAAVEAGVEVQKIAVDPGVGKWVPEKTPAHDFAILDGFRRLRSLGRPVIAAVSRKSFIGACLGQPDPAERLAGTLAATAIAVYNGAHVVRTHDVALSLETIRMAQAVRGLPASARKEEIGVEVLGHQGHGEDLAETLRRVEVDERGLDRLCRKGFFRVLSVGGLSSMEAIVIKQEMLARGGDAAIPKLALRCDPRPESVLIFGTGSQISGLVKNLKSQPFRLAMVGEAISEALEQLESHERYR
jgi:dihydropteroate synthase